MIPAVLAIGDAWVGFKVILGVAVFATFAFILRLGAPRDLRRGLVQIRKATLKA